MRYVLTAFAKKDLRDITEYLLEHAGEEVTIRMVSEIVEAIMLRATQPRSGILVSQVGEEVRRFPVRNYLVYYRVRRSRMQILHVFHAARNQKKAWKG